MEKKDKDLFEELKSLNINYGKEDVRSRYVGVANEIDLTKFINFCDEGVENKILHCTISVKIDDENSDFIPFVVGWGKSKTIARKLLENGYKSIFYTHVNLINDVIEDCCKRGEDRASINRLSFRAVWDAEKKTVDFLDGYSFIPSVTPKTNAYWYEHAEDDDEITPLLRKLVLRNDITKSTSSVGIDGAGSFVYEIMKSYNEMDSSIKELNFHFINVDRNLNKTDLTRVMFIYQDENFFMKNFFERSFPRIREVASAIRTRYVYDLLAKSKYEATKSAKAAIMSRNMSHNIGSHVMSYLKQKLGSITAIMDKDSNVLYNLTDDEYLKRLMDQRELGNPEVLQSAIQNVKKDNSSEENNTTSKNKTTSKKKIEFPFLVGTGRFIGYLQERQDYIATIATDYIPYGAPVNLKDAIYDELNPDLRHMRHSNDDGNRPMNVLLSFIAKSEQLSRENMKIEGQTFSTHNDILFGFPKYEEDGKKPVMFGIEPGEGSDTKNVALSVMRKVNFSLPGGLVGRQAIFSIVENLIRNAAKHGHPCGTKQDGDGKDVGNLELTFDVIDLASMNSEPCINERIYDSKWRALYESASDREQLYLFTITDNLTYKADAKGKTLVDKMLPTLIEDYLDEKGNMRPTNKGIKEIRISAAWMRDEVVEERYLRYGDYNDDLDVIKAKDKKAPLVGLEITKEGHLRYMICLPQDRLAAVITDGMSEDDIKLFKELQNYSTKDWTLYTTIDDARKDSKMSYHYMLVAPEKYNQLRPYTSNRLFKWELGDEERKALEAEKKNEKDDEKKYKLTKNAILRKLYNVDRQSDPIYIWDGKRSNTEIEEGVNGKIIVDDTEQNANTAKYAYRTHHSTDTQFESYWKKKTATEGDDKNTYSQLLRIDAVTGDNSSDRIVRREPLTEEWYCSHLRAFKKQVAIFDERLFKIVHNVDEGEFVANAQSDNAEILKTTIDRLKNNENLEDIKNVIVEHQLLGKDSNLAVKYSKTSQALLSKLEAKTIDFKPKSANNYKSIVYKEKGVDVFTIVREKDNSFAVIGYVGQRTDENGTLIETMYDKVATITSVAEPFGVNIQFQHEEFAKQYDYISIHQGILDKIYEGFGIKDHGEVNDPKKCRVTRHLHEAFMKENEYTPLPVHYDKEGNRQEDLDFLPCFIIHSGRAKPTKNDMPQELPFVQYAAIEHGVQDCKYALVELLDYARYEE